MAIKKLPLPHKQKIYSAIRKNIADVNRHCVVKTNVIPPPVVEFQGRAEVIDQTSTTPVPLNDIPYFRRKIALGRAAGYTGDLRHEYVWWLERPKDGAFYVYQSTIWHLTGKHCDVSEEHQKLLIMQEVDKERKDFERLKRLYDSDATKEAKHKREPIPEDVRIAAWRRDEGKCVQCDSNERLEYDHIIPVSKGGSNTVRNIQLLCETCNRQKSDSI